jgi:hypothetical protein
MVGKDGEAAPALKQIFSTILKVAVEIDRLRLRVSKEPIWRKLSAG